MKDISGEFVETTDCWAITHGDYVDLASVRKTRAESWWSVQQTSGKTRRDLQNAGFRAEKIVLCRPIRSAPATREIESQAVPA